MTPVQPVTGPALPPPLPATADAVRAGVLGAEHVEVIRRVITTLPPEVPVEERDKAEQTLVDAARIIDPVAVAKLGRTVHAVLDQDGRPPTDTQLRHPVNELRWVIRGNGTLDLKGRLAAEGAALLTGVLSPLAKPRPATDGDRDPRTPAERHGDALVDALRLAANSGDLPTEGGERPTLIVTIPSTPSATTPRHNNHPHPNQNPSRSHRPSRPHRPPRRQSPWTVPSFVDIWVVDCR